jgi:uncharacterized membrane protein HdeD (DUF308 family)
MTAPAHRPLRVFCSYAHEDEERLNVLREWLRGLERQGLINWWHDRQIVPGWEWEEAIDKNLRTAEVILLLVTPDFMASDYVYEKEIDRAIERHERGEARVIPIMVRPADWEWASFGKLQALPKDAKPITTWLNQDEAWLDVIRGIRRAVKELLVERQQAAREHYRQAVEGAWIDNKIGDAEAEELSTLTTELGLSVDTAAGIERNVMGDTIESILEGQEQRKRLEELYSRARRSHRRREWQAVVDIFEQIRAEEPDYPDREGLLASARDALEVQEHTQKVAALYHRGEQHIDAEEWQQALECLEEVQRLEPGYQGTEELLSQVRQELARPSTVTVPNLDGQEVRQARGTLASSNLKLGKQHLAPSDTISEGQIIEQSPEAGTEVEADTMVSVTISLGSQTATAADSLSEGVTESELAEPPPSSHQPGQLDSGSERVEPRTWQEDRMVGQSTDQTVRVQPDYSTDTEPQPTLPMLGRNWWALALGGLIIVILGMVVYLAWQFYTGEHVAFRSLVSILLVANGVFAILASRTASTRLLLHTQGMVSVLAGLVAFLSSWTGASLVLLVHYVNFDSWGLILGIIQIVLANRFGWDVKDMWLIVVSGASLVICSMYGFFTLFQPTAFIPFLFAIWLLASGVSLVVFAFRIHQREAAEVEG